MIEGHNKIKVIDFGTAISFNPEKGMDNILGTPFYMAPEIFNDGTYNEKCDMWSLGVILFVMLTGRPPFYGSSDAEVIKRVKLGFYPKQGTNFFQITLLVVLADKGITDQAQDLISRLLTKDTAKRISA